MEGGRAMSQGITTLIFNPLDPAFINNPYPIYAALRERDPIHRSPMGIWLITRYRDVLNALGDPRLSNEPAPYAVVHRRNSPRYLAAQVANNIIPYMDPPRHTTSKKLISQSFHAQLSLAPPDIEGIATRLLDKRRAKGEIDIIGDFATPMAIAVIGDLLGIPEQDQGQLKKWSESFFYLFSAISSNEVLARLEHGLMEFRRYFADLIQERLKTPRKDLISDLIQAADGQHRLSEAEIIDTCMLLFSDGVENVDSGIGNSVVALLAHPSELRRLQEDPKLIHPAVEECLRYDTPGQFIPRVALEDIAFGKKVIGKNAGVFLALASANRDPAQFHDPDRLDITREQNPQLAFGRGRHSCIGAPLVRLEIATGINVILRHLRDLKQKEVGFKWMPRLGHRWLENLPVTFTPY
jgi:pimeloyl-[acyl-carrier protein] synthase